MADRDMRGSVFGVVAGTADRTADGEHRGVDRRAVGPGLDRQQVRDLSVEGGLSRVELAGHVGELARVFDAAGMADSAALYRERAERAWAHGEWDLPARRVIASLRPRLR